MTDQELADIEERADHLAGVAWCSAPVQLASAVRRDHIALIAEVRRLRALADAARAYVRTPWKPTEMALEAAVEALEAREGCEP